MPGWRQRGGLRRKFPHIPAKFFSTGKPPYINAKVASMELMEKSAAHDILVISDSDVRVTPDYLRAVALPFADEKVGGMCCPYRGIAAGGGLWARLEAVGMSVEMTAGVLVARMMEGMQFVLGPTMAFRRDAIRRMGGFKVTADYCADDFVLGNETYKLGQTVVLSHHAIDHIVINLSLMASLKHQVRWMKSTRFSRPKGHFGTALTFSMPFGLLGLAAGLLLGHPLWGVALLAWALATRLALSLAVGRSVVRDPSWFNLLVLYPVRDLMGFLLLGSELHGQPHSMARARVSIVAGREDERRELSPHFEHEMSDKGCTLPPKAAKETAWMVHPAVRFRSCRTLSAARPHTLFWPLSHSFSPLLRVGSRFPIDRLALPSG